MKEGRKFYKRNKKHRQSYADKQKEITVGLGAAVCFLAALIFLYSMDKEAAAEELGGFQVEMGTGENTSLPSDWENVPEDDRETQAQAEKPETNEFPSQWEGESHSDTQMEAEEHWEGNAAYVEGSQSVQNQNQENSLAGEAFGDGSQRQESIAIPKTETKKKPEPETGSEGNLTVVPEVSFTPEAQKTPSPAPLVTPFIKESQTQEISQEEVKDQKSPADISTQLPCIFCWKEKAEFDNSLYLKIIAEGEIKVLSVKINRKECAWSWRTDGIEIIRESKETFKSTALLEIVLVTYGKGPRGIFIDGKNKPCYTIQ